ncbi:MAG: archaeal proteasome endopeptidase complex subunit alpha [archaeon]|nr:archaeal proteasome endopeptidase complex subunit alpha [archaeon]
MLNRGGMGGYDHSLTMFSPDGRLFQVEYALEAVRRGTLTVGIKNKAGAVIVIIKKLPSSLMDPESYPKLYQVDNHVGVATSGLHADSRILVDYARVQCQVNRLSYNEPVRLGTLVRKLADIKQQFTQYGGRRPFGSALLFIGVDSDGQSQLMTTSPTGRYWSWKATCLGTNEEQANKLLKEKYSDVSEGTLEDIMLLGLQVQKDCAEDEIKPEMVVIAYVDANATEPEYSLLDKTKIKEIVKKLS